MSLRQRSIILPSTVAENSMIHTPIPCFIVLPRSSECEKISGIPYWVSKRSTQVSNPDGPWWVSTHPNGVKLHSETSVCNITSRDLPYLEGHGWKTMAGNGDGQPCTGEPIVWYYGRFLIPRGDTEGVLSYPV